MRSSKSFMASVESTHLEARCQSSSSSSAAIDNSGLSMRGSVKDEKNME
jgi:hypothetical protein